jgi:hypothetical protein
VTDQEFTDALPALRLKLVNTMFGVAKNMDDAEDVVQRALLLGWQGFKRGLYGERCSLYTWLCTIAMNEFFGICRRAKRWPQVPLDEAEDTSSRKVDQPLSPKLPYVHPRYVEEIHARDTLGKIMKFRNGRYCSPSQRRCLDKMIAAEGERAPYRSLQGKANDVARFNLRARLREKGLGI